MGPELHPTRRAQGESCHDVTEHWGVAVPSNRGTRRIFGHQPFDEQLSIDAGPLGEPRADWDQKRRQWRPGLGPPRIVAIGPSEVRGAALCDDAAHHDVGKRQRLDLVEQGTFLSLGYEVVAVLEAVGHGRREQRGSHG